MKEKALVAMSGGVDSSVAAALILENFGCSGVTLKLHGGDNTDFDDARLAAEKLMIPHTVLDFTEFFNEEVIRRFITAYENGLTPNPCIDCNKYIKFGLLFNKVRELNCDFLVTGHYAQIEKSGGRCLLKKARDQKKDQSYVLYSLSQEILASSRFPLGSLTKSEVREIAFDRGLCSASKQESQDICFVPDGDYGKFMESYTGKRYPEGDIIDIDGKKIGRHRGIVRYTLGQRRGLGVAVNTPVYVCAKDIKRNTVTLGPENSLYTKRFFAERINLIACDTLEKPARLMVKTRYLQQEKPAVVQQTGPDEISVEFDEAQRAVTPGQSAVFYDGETVVGGGIIHTVGV